MRTFTIIWIGQFVTTIGSYMTEFVLILWAWETTRSATALTLVGFFSQLSRVLVTLFSGIIVDRFNRKYLIMLSDAISVLSTVLLLGLYLSDHLQIWHLYLTSAINSSFGQIQNLAYSASMSLIVPQQHYTRASGMLAAVHYGATIFAPALAGVFYPTIGLTGVLSIDIATFAVAIATVFAVPIPRPACNPIKSLNLNSLWYDISFGFKYFLTDPGLRLLVLITLLFWFAHDLGGAIYDPMILARSGGSAQVLASTSMAAGLGGVTGAIGVSVWGGLKRRINGLLLGMVGAGISKTVFGLGQIPLVWVSAQFCSSLNFPLLSSSETAIWMAKVAPEIQGRVFAASALLLQIVSAMAILAAGLLADRVFEPAMASETPAVNLLGEIFGSGSGSGMAFLYVLCSLSMMLIGMLGYKLPQLRRVDDRLTNP